MTAADLLRVEALTERIDKLEEQLATVIWLHAELMYGLRLVAAAQFIQQPEVKQALIDQIMNGASS